MLNYDKWKEILNGSWQIEKPEEIKQNIYKKTAIHRFATIDEIVDAFRFCFENHFINGSLIEVNGGYCFKLKYSMLNKNIIFYSHLSPAKKATIWYTLCNIFQKGIAFIVIPIYVRLLTPTEYGNYMNHPKRKKEGTKSKKRICTIGKALVNDLRFYLRVLNQKRTDTHKIYSLHEPEVRCIAKGKEAKPYEFGNKSGIAKTKTGVIVGAIAFEGNPFDGHTLPEQLEQIKRLTAITKRQKRGRSSVKELALNQQLATLSTIMQC